MHIIKKIKEICGIATGNLVTYKSAKKILNAPDGVYNAFLNSGLLGNWQYNTITKKGLDSFTKYGTQWREDLTPRYFPFQSTPDPWEREKEEVPPGGQIWIRLTPGKGILEHAHEDYGWITHFYLKPNPFFFPNPNEVCLVGPLQIKLDSIIEVEGPAQKVMMYPSPEGELAMIMVAEIPSKIKFENPNAVDDIYKTSYGQAGPLLDEISVRMDQPALFAQIIIVGVPSGIIYFRFARHSDTTIYHPDEGTTPYCPFPAIRDANALYREGLSSSSPFNRFLAFYKVYENIIYIRSAWRKDFKKEDYKLIEEIIPEGIEFQRYKGLSFKQAIEKLNKPYRTAIAHGKVDPKTSAELLISNRLRILLFGSGFSEHAEELMV